MKKRYILNGIFLLCATTLVASEAYSPIAYGVKSLGMGGVGIATPQGAESIFENPALLSYLKNNEVSVGVTGTKHVRSLSGDFVTYDSENTYTPYMALNYRVNDKFVIGFATSKYKMQNSLVDDNMLDIKKTRAIIPLSYQFDNFSFGASLVVEKENYFINDLVDSTNNMDSTTTDCGYVFGIAYKFSQKNILIAAEYKSKIEHNFYRAAANHHFHLNSPSELGVGLHWKIANTHSSIGVDYKRILSSEIYYKTDPTSWFEDQNVYAIGYSYDTKKWSLRAGYRYVDSIYEYDLLDFSLPFMSKSHYTVGGTYHFTSHFSTDVAVEYAPYDKALADLDGSNLTANDTSVSLSLNYTF